MSLLGWIILGVIVVIVVFVVLMVLWAKGQYKKDAYRLLKKTKPDPQEVRETIKNLNYYVGRWSKDEEVGELIRRLMKKLER